MHFQAILLLFQRFTDFAEGIRLPTADGGFICEAGNTHRMENIGYVDDRLLIINPGGNDGNRQQ